MTIPASNAAPEFPISPRPAHDAAAAMAALVADRPMTRVTMPVGGEVWVVHRNQAAREVLSDSRFIRQPFRTGERAIPFRSSFPDFLRSTIQFEDPPQHTRLRKLVQKGISPKQIKAMRSTAVVFANSLIDEMVAKGGPRNIMREYAIPLPIEMLSNLLGVPSADRDKFERWSSAFLGLSGKTVEQMGSDMAELGAYMSDLIAQRRIAPKDDLLSSLANARELDDTLSDAEILPIAFLLIIAGFDNTANFIATGILALLRDDEQRAKFQSDPDGLSATMTEEVLRHGRFMMGTPVGAVGNLVPFIATEDIVVDGQLIKAGDAVGIDMVTSGHDPVALIEPESFDITRTVNPHLTLSYGIHHCLGAPLARMELQVGIAEIFKRLPDLALVGEPTFDANHIAHPMTELLVQW